MDMFKCSDQRDFAEQPEKDSFSSSSKLYQFLSTRLQNLSVSIKTFLEFVSNSILYLLGFNPQMFERSGSGDGSGASCKKSSYFDYKKDDASENGDSCGAYSSTKYLSGDSGNELDSSDSESRCCFAVSRLKRLVLRQSRQRYHARRRHEIGRIKQKAHESETPKRGKQNLNVGDGQKENITSITGCSTEEDKIRLQNTPSTERKEGVSLSKSISAEEIDQSVNIETLQDLCRKSVT